MARPFLVVMLFAGSVILAHFLDFSSLAQWGIRSDLLHVVAFAALGYGAMRLLLRYGTSLLAGAIFTLIGTAALGSLGELAQVATSRNADLGDLIRDLIGAGIGVCLSAALVARRARPLFALAGVVLLFAGSSESIREVVALWRARAGLPVVDDFEGRSKRPLWRSTGASFEIEASGAGHELCATFREGSYPGIARRLPGDWSPYRRFSLRAETDKPVELVVRIHDRDHDDRHRDRFNQTLHLEAGPHELEFDLDQVRAGPKNRELDLSRLGELVFFVPRPKAPVSICFDDLRLHR